MQRPLKSLRKSDVISSLLAEDTPLDVSEQQQIINGLEQEQEKQHKWKLVFAALAGTLGCWFLYAAIQQLMYPYQQRYTGELQAVTAARPAAVVLLVQGAALLMSCCGLLAGLLTRSSFPGSCAPRAGTGHCTLLAAIAATLTGCFYWSWALWQSVQRFGMENGAHWELLWLPYGPSVLAGLCWYVDFSIEATGHEVQQLKRLMYDHKKV
jgi:predicted permease